MYIQYFLLLPGVLYHGSQTSQKVSTESTMQWQRLSDYPWNRKIQSTVKNVFLEMVVSNFILFKMKNDCNMHTILGTTTSLYRFSMNVVFDFWIAAEQRCKTTFLSSKFFSFLFLALKDSYLKMMKMFIHTSHCSSFFFLLLLMLLKKSE